MSSEPKYAKIRVDGKPHVIERALLSSPQKQELDDCFEGFINLPGIPTSPSEKFFKDACVGTSFIGKNQSTLVKPESLENIYDKMAREQDERDLNLGRAIRTLELLTRDQCDVKGKYSKDDLDVSMVNYLYDQVVNIKSVLGELAKGTIFDNTNDLVASLLGISSITVYRKRKRIGEEKPEKEKISKKQRILNMVTDEQRKEIFDHVQECFRTDTNFTLSTLLVDLKERFNFQYGRSSLHDLLRAMDLVYKVKTYNPMVSDRVDIVAWRGRYLRQISELREAGAYITFFDETWIYHGMVRKHGWDLKNHTAYELARIGSMRNPIPGFAAGSDKGVRAIVLAVLTPSGILEASIDVVTSKRPASEQLVDYHKSMDSEMYYKYMEKVLPEIVAAAPPGRQPVMVIDNCAIHNQTTLKLPTKSSKKEDITNFLKDQGVAVDPSLKKDELWDEADSYMRMHGGRKALMKYEVDEMAARLGVQIVRLPPYHCCLNPIELIWNQLKSFLRKHGKFDSKLETVRTQAIQFLKSIDEEAVANIMDHVMDAEIDLKTIMDADFEQNLREDEMDSGDDDISF